MRPMYQATFPKNGFVQVMPCQQQLSPTIYYQVLDLRLRKHDEVLDQLSFQMHQLSQRVHKIEEARIQHGETAC